MEPLNARLIADAAGLDPVYVDGIAGAINLGENFGTLYFRWMPRCGDAGVVVYDRVPVLYLVRPRASILTPDCGLAAMVRSLPGPRRLSVGMH